MRKIVDGKMSDTSLLQKDSIAAKSAVCPINSNLRFCSNNEMYFYEETGLSNDLIDQFCTNSDGISDTERLWNADSCLDDVTEWNDFLLHPSTRFRMIKVWTGLMGSLFENDRENESWHEEAFYVAEVGIPAIISRPNYSEDVCNAAFGN